jgi:hypothetical protein
MAISPRTRGVEDVTAEVEELIYVGNASARKQTGVRILLPRDRGCGEKRTGQEAAARQRRRNAARASGDRQCTQPMHAPRPGVWVEIWKSGVQPNMTPGTGEKVRSDAGGRADAA